MAKARTKKPATATGVIRETVGRPVEAVAFAGIVAGEPVEAIPLDEIEVLPGNPPPDPRVVADVKLHGQDEPAILLAPGMLVSPPNVEITMDPAKYLLLAGASRLQAARESEWPTLECRVRREKLHLVEAISFALRSNTSRRVVKTAEKAARVKQLADCGMRDHEIGNTLGINRVEVCELRKWETLPQSWRSMVGAYEVGDDAAPGFSWAAAKLVLPYLDIPGLVEWFDRNVIASDVPLTRARMRDALADGLAEITYFVGEPVFDPYLHAWRDWPDADKIDADTWQKLDLRDLPCAVGSEKRACAPWEIIDAVLLPPQIAKQREHGEREEDQEDEVDEEDQEDKEDEVTDRAQVVGRAEKPATAAADTPSAKAHAAKRHDEQDADLAERFWSSGGLGPIGQRIAAATCSSVAAGSAEARQTFQLLSACARDKDSSASLDHAHWLAVATESLFSSPRGFGGQKPASMPPLKFREGWHKPASDDYSGYFATIAKLDDPLSAWDEIELQFCRLLLWPVCEVSFWGVSAPDSWPRDLPWLDRSVLAAVLELFNVSLVDTWHAARESVGTNSQPEAWLRYFFSVHDDRQLDDLAAAIVDKKASSAFCSDWSRATSRKQRMDTLLHYHRNRHLGLPRLLGEPSKKRRKP